MYILSLDYVCGGQRYAHMSVDTARGQKRARNDSPVAGIPGGCELPGMGEKQNSRTLEEQHSLNC